MEPGSPGGSDVGRTGADAVEALAASFGPYARRLFDVVAMLAQRPRPLEELIRGSGLSRRTVEELLAAAGSDVGEREGGYALRRDVADAYAARFALARGAPGETEPAAPVAAGIAREVARLVAEAPAAKERLDHVAATPRTALRRAAWLGEAYDPARTRLLCVGDHDLTALAACLVNPGLSARVADIDEDLLAYIDASARRLSLDVACYYADLRFCLPPDLAGWGDVAFTDPPYTPEGVSLFAARALEGLRDREFGNVVVAYGAGERRPALAWKVQQALAGDLGLAFEAILPKFNAYAGAQAIGSRSDLYVCRPTSGTWKLLERARHDQPRIYSRGPQSLEAGGEPPSARVQQAVIEMATRDGAVRLAGVVADGWDQPGAHARLATLLVKGLPAEWARSGGTVVVDLSADPGPWLARALLAANAARVVALIPNNHPDAADAAGQAALRELLGAKYDLRFHRSFPGPAHAVVEAAAAADPSPGARLRRSLLERAHGSARNAWREGLIRLAREAGRPLTKNEARAAIEAAGPLPPWQASRLIDMPRSQIAELLPRLDASARGAPGLDPPTGPGGPPLAAGNARSRAAGSAGDQ